jgi:hypothetical protein
MVVFIPPSSPSYLRVYPSYMHMSFPSSPFSPFPPYLVVGEGAVVGHKTRLVLLACLRLLPTVVAHRVPRSGLIKDLGGWVVVVVVVSC